MVLVCLVQHGEAVSEDVDPRRPLSERGRQEVERVASFLAKIGFKPTRIVHSTKLRAKQTAEILAEKLKPVHGVEEVEGLEPLADPRPWAEKLGGIGGTLMIVGHLPHLAKLAGLLLVGNQEADIIRFRYGGVFCLERSEKGWKLAWAITPEIIPD